MRTSSPNTHPPLPGQVYAPEGGALYLTTYHLKRSMKLILSYKRLPASSPSGSTAAATDTTAPPSGLSTVVILSSTLGYFHKVPPGDDLTHLLGDAVLEANEAVGCLCFVAKPTFGQTPTGVGEAHDKHSPWRAESSSCPSLYYVGDEASVDRLEGDLKNFLASCGDINCAPPQPWPEDYYGEQMAQEKAKAEAGRTLASIFESHTVAEESQDETDRKAISI